jgi:hypothetical protein
MLDMIISMQLPVGYQDDEIKHLNGFIIIMQIKHDVIIGVRMNIVYLIRVCEDVSLQKNRKV